MILKLFNWLNPTIAFNFCDRGSGPGGSAAVLNPENPTHPLVITHPVSGRRCERKTIESTSHIQICTQIFKICHLIGQDSSSTWNKLTNHIHFAHRALLVSLQGVRNLVEILADGTTEVEMEQRESWEFISRIMRPGKLVYL